MTKEWTLQISIMPRSKALPAPLISLRPLSPRATTYLTVEVADQTENVLRRIKVTHRVARCPRAQTGTPILMKIDSTRRYLDLILRCDIKNHLKFNVGSAQMLL